MTPELDDEVSKVHTSCPFCGGEYVVGSGVIRHSSPTCHDFESRPSSDFMRAAHEKEKERIIANARKASTR